MNRNLLIIFLAVATVQPAFSTSHTLSDSLNKVADPDAPSQLLSLAFGIPTKVTHKWSPQFAIRAGYGLFLDENVSLRLYSEYSRFNLTQSDGLYRFASLAPVRQDIALYSTIVLFHMVEAGVGAYYSTSDQAILQNEYFRPTIWAYSGYSNIHFLVSIGFMYTIRITEHLSCPIGFYYHGIEYATDGSVWLRIGPELAF